MSHSLSARDPRKESAAQNAQEGLVTVADLSLLTGVPVAQLTKFAKSGLLEHYGEYHGKRFFNFQEIVVWALSPDGEDVARGVIRKGIESELSANDCPYAIETLSPTEDRFSLRLSWKVASAA